ncbi:MAG: FAD-dependent oxidoreductase [Saprospiraceae bacterium]
MQLPTDRPSSIEKLNQQEVDLLVIGGGLTGAGIALDAASRGMITVLVDRSDVGSGASTHTSNILHAGFPLLRRGLRQLIRKLGPERKILLDNALPIVHPQRVLLPIDKKMTLGRLRINRQFNTYDKLTGNSKHHRHQLLKRPSATRQEPTLEANAISGAIVWEEYATRDHRLLLEVLKKAQELGAIILPQMEATQAKHDETGKITGYSLQDRESNSSYALKAAAVVHCHGTWMPDTRYEALTHVILPREKLPVKQAIYFYKDDVEVPFYVFPVSGHWVQIGGKVHEGTQGGHPASPGVESLKRLLESTSQYFHIPSLEVTDIQYAWHESYLMEHAKFNWKNAVYKDDQDGFFALNPAIGHYRLCARQAVDQIVNHLQEKGQLTRIKECYTDLLKIAGSEFLSRDEYQNFSRDLLQNAGAMQLKPEAIQHLLDLYGKNTELILGHYNTLPTPELNPDTRLLQAELWYSVHYEWALHVDDFLIRRTRRFLTHPQSIEEDVKKVADFMGQELGWDRIRREEEVKRYEEAIKMLKVEG